MVKIINKSKNQEFKFPILGYSGYFFTKFFDTFKPISYLLDSLETHWLRNDLDGLSISNEDIEELLHVDTDAWKAEVPDIEEYFNQFGDRCPERIKKQLEALKSRLT